MIRVVTLIMAGALIGCGGKPASSQPQAVGSTPADDDRSLAGLMRRAPKVDEDPALAASFKAKGWRQMGDVRMSDNKPLVFLSIPGPLKDADAGLIAQSKAVQVLDARDAKLSDAALKTILDAPNLEGLVLGGDTLTDAGIAHLAASGRIDDVTLTLAEKVTPAGFKLLAKMPKLRALHLLSGTIDAAVLAALAECKTLKRLTLEYVNGLDDAGAGHLAKFPALDYLKLPGGLGGDGMTAAGLRAIAAGRVPAKFEFDTKLLDDESLQMLVAKGWLYGPSPPGTRPPRPATAADLQSINFSGSAVTDKGLAALGDLPGLESVFLDRTGATDETLKRLAKSPKLRYLSLEKTKISAAGLEAVAGLPIETLRLGDATLTEDAFKVMGRMVNLKDLNLASAKYQPAWLTHLKGLANLRELYLLSAAFDDAAAKELSAMPALESLTLNSTQLGDAGFAELLKLPALKSLLVDGTRVTKEVYLKAKKERPKVRFYFYSYDQAK